MKKQLITAGALIALAATAFGAVQATTAESPVVCIPAAVAQAWS